MASTLLIGLAWSFVVGFFFMEGDHFHHIFSFITLVWIFRLIFSFERKELKASRTGRDAPAFDSVYSPAY